MPEVEEELLLKMPSNHPITQIPEIKADLDQVKAHLAQLEQKINAIGAMTEAIYRAVFAAQQEQAKSGIVVPGR